MIQILRNSLCKPFFAPRRFFISTLKDDIFTISLIGKPNVGKSTLFNKLSGGLHAITDRMPGLTRDRNEIITKLWGGFPIRLVDTAGWETLSNKELQENEIKKKMIDQTSQALVYSDLALFIIDVKEGITQTDLFLAKWLRKRQMERIRPDALKRLNDENEVIVKNIMLIANKCEYEDESDIYRDIYQLGFGDPLFVSAEHGDGLQDLIGEIEKAIPEEKKKAYGLKKGQRRERFNNLKEKLKREIMEVQRENKTAQEEDFDIKLWEKEFDKMNKDPEENSDFDSDGEIDPEKMVVKDGVATEPGMSTENFYTNRSIQISIVGKPNVGKSSLVNSLLKEKRVIVDDLPGTTRDAISVRWFYKGKRINLIDTAGIEKSLKFKGDIEKKIHRSTLNAIKYSHVILCVIDSINAFRVQDLSVAQYIVDQGRAIILLINKWDLVQKEYRSKASKFMQKQVERALNEVKDVPMIYISAKTGLKIDGVMDEVLKVYEKWNTRISTGVLNNWMRNMKKVQLLPTDGGNDLKIRFVSQIKARPPTFAFFVNDRTLFKENYFRFVKAKLTEEFGLQGVPIRILIRDIDYKKNKKYLEKTKKIGSIKKYFLKRRRLAAHARKKIEALNKKMKQNAKEGSKPVK